MSADERPARGRLRRVAHNLKQGLSLAWTASPESLVRYSLLGILSAAMPPISVFLGATLVNRIASARLQAIGISELVPVLIGLCCAATAEEGDATWHTVSAATSNGESRLREFMRDYPAGRYQGRISARATGGP